MSIERKCFPSGILAALFLAHSAGASLAGTIPVAELHTRTHIHGLAVDRGQPSNLLIATHHGLFHAEPDGMATLVSPVQDFMGFNPHPSDPDRLFASGHPAEGGNLGFIASTDKGRTWTQISPGLNGPVDFHQLAVSPAEPDRIYGAYDGLQMSEDGGRMWTLAGLEPERLIDLAASAISPDAVYAATEGGLLVSVNAGKKWTPLVQGEPVTLVETTPEYLYAFVYGKGLVRAREGTLNWTTLSSDWGDDYLLHVAVDPTAPERLYAVTGHSQVLKSTDGGKTWSPFGQ